MKSCIPTLETLCAKVVADHIDSVEDLTFVPDEQVSKIALFLSDNDLLSLSTLRVLFSVSAVRQGSRCSEDMYCGIGSRCINKRDVPPDVAFPHRKRFFTWFTEQIMLRGDMELGTEMTHEEIDTFACHSELNELVVKSCPIHSVPILNQFPTLTRLDLSHSKMGIKGAEVLRDALEGSAAQLQDLMLEDCWLSCLGTKYIADLFAHLPCLSSLNLQWNDIGENGCQSLATAIQQHSCECFHSLDLTHNFGGRTMSKCILVIKKLLAEQKKDRPLQIKYI